VAGGGAFPNFTFHGGPIVNKPQVYALFVGNWSSAASQNRATRLQQFISDLLDSNYMNILSQYGCGSSGSLVKSIFVPSPGSSLSTADIHGILQKAINNQLIPEPVNRSDVHVLYLDDSTAVDDTSAGAVMCEATSDNAFGYHDFFTTTAGNICVFAVVPGLTNACLQSSCPGDDAGCSLHLSQSQEQRQTQVTSHEFSEMISNPQVGGDEGWSNPGSPHENGDICNGQTGTIAVSGRTWTVQLMYSKVHDVRTNGATTCIAGTPAALPSLLVYVLGADGKLWLENGPFGTIPPPRRQIDGNVADFQVLDTITLFVLGTDGKLWLEHGPFGTVPPPRQQVDANVAKFQALNTTTAFVLGTDGKLWLEDGPFGAVPPTRKPVDASVTAFQAIDTATVLVLGGDGKLWLEHGPFGVVPPSRQQVDANVARFQALDANQVVVLGKDGNLWLEQGPFGTVPPQRRQIDGNVAAFQALNSATVFVLGTDGKLWLEHAPFGVVPPARQQVDANVKAFEASDANSVLVLGIDGKLWQESGPFGTIPPSRDQVDANVAKFK
jgi:hypothetical protein